SDVNVELCGVELCWRLGVMRLLGTRRVPAMRRVPNKTSATCWRADPPPSTGRWRDPYRLMTGFLMRRGVVWAGGCRSRVSQLLVGVVSVLAVGAVVSVEALRAYNVRWACRATRDDPRVVGKW